MAKLIDTLSSGIVVEYAQAYMFFVDLGALLALVSYIARHDWNKDDTTRVAACFFIILFGDMIYRFGGWLYRHQLNAGMSPFFWPGVPIIINVVLDSIGIVWFVSIISASRRNGWNWATYFVISAIAAALMTYQ